MHISSLRAEARFALKGNWGMAILVTLIAGILGGTVATGSGSVEIDADVLQRLPAILRTYLFVAASIGAALGLVQFIIGGTVRLGYCKYLLKLQDGKKGELKDLFSEFGRFGDGFVLSLLQAVYTFLWTLLFIIPGLIATLKYAMAPFIMLENPDMGANDCITASKEMMYGHKGDLFLLHLSFFGWALLSALTLGIGNLWLNPYMNAAEAAFYRNLCPRANPVAEVIPEQL